MSTPNGRYSGMTHESNAPKAQPQSAEDTATIKAIKGKGFAFTVAPSFVVAVIVGVTSALFSHKPDQATQASAEDSKQCKESVTQLRREFDQFRSESRVSATAQEYKMNQILILSGKPQVIAEASELARQMGQALTK